MAVDVRHVTIWSEGTRLAADLFLPDGAAPVFGFHNSSEETAREIRFMVVPDPKLAEEHLRILTQAPHMAGTPEDKATADWCSATQPVTPSPIFILKTPRSDACGTCDARSTNSPDPDSTR